MNIKTKIPVLTVLALATFLIGPFNTSAQYVVPDCDRATFSGSVVTNGATTQAWFEWGPGTSITVSTPKQTFTQDGQMTQTVTNLSPNSSYSYRVKAQNTHGTAVSSVISFVTPSCQNNNPPQTPSPSVSITADNSSVSYASNTTVRWTSNNATSCSASGGANGWSGSKTTSGHFKTGTLTNSTTYYITCHNSSGSDSKSVTVSVGSQPQTPKPVVDLTADNYFVDHGGATTIRWTTNNATSCSASGGTNGWSGSKSTSDNFHTGALFNDTTFHITCSNSSGSASDHVTVNVNGQQIQNPTVNLTADNSNLSHGGATTIRWNSSNATSCSASGGTNGWPGSKPTSDHFFTGNLFNTTTFSISCSNSSGQVTRSVTVNVSGQQTQNPTVDLKADRFFVDYGESTTVRWESSNATSCSASGGANSWSGSKSTSGNFHTGALFGDTTFNITCSNSSGSRSDHVTISVGNDGNNDQPNVSLRADDTNLDEGESTTVRWNSNDADSCFASDGTNSWSGSRSTTGSFNTGSLFSDVTYRITCHNQNGSDTDSVTVRVDNNNNFRNVSVSLNADNRNISNGGNTIIRWNSNNANSCFASDGTNNWSGNRGTSGSFNTGSLFNTTTFRINCSNSSDSASDSVTVNVGGQFSTSLIATTLGATNVTSSSARLNSQTFNSTNNPANTWFEWGTTANLGNRTNTTNIGAPLYTTHAAILSGLSPNTTYFYRIVSENSIRRSEGGLLSFTTGSQTFTPPPPTTSLTANVFINSTIDSRPVVSSLDNTTPAPGDEINYTINYQNTGNGSARNLVLRLTLPNEVDFVSSDPGTSSISGNVLTFNLGTLGAGQSGSVGVTVVVRGNAQIGDIITFFAELSYLDPAGRTQSTTDSISAQISDEDQELGRDSSNNFLAAVFGSGFTGSFFGLLLLLILFLILILLGKSVYDKFTRKPEFEENIKKA